MYIIPQIKHPNQNRLIHELPHLLSAVNACVHPYPPLRCALKDYVLQNNRLLHTPNRTLDRSQIQICVSGFFRSNKIVVDEKIVRVVVIDIDRDGDSDLIALTRAPRLLVWLNDGRGHFSSRTPCPPFEPPAKSFLNPDSDSETPVSPSLPLAGPTLKAEVYSYSNFSHEWSAPACGSRLNTSPRAPPLPASSSLY